MSKKIIFISISVILLVACIIFTLFFSEQKKPDIRPESTISLVSSSVDEDSFQADVVLSALDEVTYPAFSICIAFEPEQWEFIGLREGNVHVLDETETGKLPEWKVDIDQSNASGQINILYLDESSGKYAFSDKLLDRQKNNILFSLDFRQREYNGTSPELIIEDAVFASREKSLASIDGTLNIQNSMSGGENHELD